MGNQELIKQLRRWINLPDNIIISDAEILEATKGSWIRAVIELNITMDTLKQKMSENFLGRLFYYLVYILNKWLKKESINEKNKTNHK